MIANVDGGDSIHGGFDLLRVAIIDKTRGRVACHRDEAILGIIVEGVVVELRPFEDVARGHVAVLVVAVGVAVREGGHRVFVSRGVGVVRAVLAGEAACRRVVGVAFGVESVRPACDGGIRQAVERVVGEGLGLKPSEGINDGFDVANRIVIVGGVLELRSRRNLRGRDVLQASVVHVPVVVGEYRVDLVRAANQLDHPIGGIVGDGLGVGVRA